ncbi:uncharacterized protein LOC112271873 [Brachypodium distachyon]|uniref:uncharacterized protein LOC112271873 n=1 Tax=Brachypodium distachyon TaxID=15368 RepID=UPI000D0D1D55|nr:uncharacterized protein LOC112271873 [Brachypodium distachyon]|eukprot:XP_024317851.1 uncharacterized protein LOC112271873 [Brachypodium distachyon]
MSWPREGWLSNAKRDDSQRTHQQDGSQRTHEQDTEHLSPDTEVEGNLSNLQSCSADSNVVSTGDVKSASASDLNSMEDVIPNTINQSHDRSVQAATEAVCSSSTDALTTKEVPMYNMEVQSVDSEVTIPMGPSSASNSGKSMQCILPTQGLVGQNAARGDLRIDVDDPTMEKSSEMRCLLPNSHGDSAEQPGQPMANHQNGAENDGEVILVETDSINNDQATQHREKNSDSSYKIPDDARLKKSHTYILLLAILAVSLTYQAGINPPGSFWTSNATNHSAGDPILEDNYHKRYLAFFYFNATAFAASLVMIIMLLSRKMSNKVIKRRALQTVMITDLLALIGAFVVGSCREITKSIYI